MMYAIGEIVLVVIGILITLSINSWNENRKILFSLSFFSGVSGRWNNCGSIL